MREGEIILSLDGMPVQRVEDVRIELLFKKKGDRIQVNILRKDATLGDKTIQFMVDLK